MTIDNELKVVFINSARDWGGAEAWSAHFCTGIAGRGHPVTFIGHPRGQLCRRLSADARLSIEPVRIRGELDPLRVWQLARIFDRVEPEVVVTYRTRDTKLAVTANALVGGFPLAQIHHAPFPLRDSPVYRLVWRRGVDAMAVPSFATRDLLLGEAPWLSGIPMHVIHNGVDVKRFRPMPESGKAVRRELELPSAGFVLSYHGRIEPRKRVDVVIEAVARAAQHEAVYALLMGGGPDAKACRRLAASLDAPIRFMGFRSDVPRLLSAADAAIHLSTSEGLPLSVLEAMACGLPMIVSDATSHREQVQHEVHGLVVPPGRPDSAAEAILRLARNEGLRERIGAAARRRVVEEFDRERMIDRYEKFLREVVGASSANRV